MGEKVPALLYLAGLTCTEETFMIKAGAQRLASELNIALICPDTSPRGAGLAGEADSWDFGVGAGFYLDATTKPWALHWRMESYILNDLLPLVGSKLPVDLQRLGIFGHSMGGHGALTLALRHPGRFKSVSAFAPIASPLNCPWGHKAFSGYLGEDKAEWARHDASELMGAQPQPLSRRHPHRPGPGRQVPDRKAIAARSLRSRLRQGRSAAQRCAGMRATTMATISSRALSTTICATMRSNWAPDSLNGFAQPRLPSHSCHPTRAKAA
jgi:S-formylglutathione hydrolase FrmB